MLFFTLSEMLKEGYTLMESPEWTPVRSTSSIMPGDEHVLSVADGVYLDLLAADVVVHQHRTGPRRFPRRFSDMPRSCSSLATICIARPPSTKLGRTSTG